MTHPLPDILNRIHTSSCLQLNSRYHSYSGASRDPPEKQAPMCTVHSFPHNIDHCLTFARSEFEGHLEKAPAEANAFLLQPATYIQVPASFTLPLGSIITALVSYRHRFSLPISSMANALCLMLFTSCKSSAWEHVRSIQTADHS